MDDPLLQDYMLIFIHMKVNQIYVSVKERVENLIEPYMVFYTKDSSEK
jgi:hypothetical protein